MRAREIVADEIDRLMVYLDTLDTDPDLEENGDLEPSLGGEGGGYDLEEDTADAEPSLGSLDRALDQTRWAECKAYNGGCDLELDRSDHEDGGDTEPNGDELDFSDDPRGGDGGIGDTDGLVEQLGRYGGEVCS